MVSAKAASRLLAGALGCPARISEIFWLLTDKIVILDPSWVVKNQLWFKSFTKEGG
jgi:hypothetical protein